MKSKIFFLFMILVSLFARIVVADNIRGVFDVCAAKIKKNEKEYYLSGMDFTMGEEAESSKILFARDTKYEKFIEYTTYKPSREGRAKKWSLCIYAPCMDKECSYEAEKNHQLGGRDRLELKYKPLSRVPEKCTSLIDLKKHRLRILGIKCKY